MYPRQDYQVYGGNQYSNGYYHPSTEANYQYSTPAQDVNSLWSNQQQQQQPLQHKMVYPTDMSQPNNSRLDPTLAYPVALRPSTFEHGRFIDKMQPGFTRVKTEKYFDSPYAEDIFPIDPRLWTREDVARWLRWISEAYSLKNIKPDRFEMNGKGLCLMTLDMFLYRVPEGGRVLYHDFQRRLRIAVGS